MKKSNLSKTTLLFISLSMSLSILFGFSIYRNLSIETPIRIEDFTSMTQDQLLAWSQEKDIKIETVEEYSDELEAGEIISQNVVVGERLFAGSTVKVIISKGPNPEVMINLIDFKGKDIGEVQQFIELNRLLAASIEFEKSTDVNSAYFIRTDVQAISIKRGQAIKFYISTGSKEELTTVVVPDFIEYTRQQISSWGQSNNIKTNITEEFNNDISAGKVISQSQAPNTSIYDGSSVTIKMSLGAGVVLENLVGKSKSTIDKFINDNGLKVNYSYTYSSAQNKDLGISMSPSASTKVGNGTTVNVTLSLGKISITDFKGKTLASLQAWVAEVNKQGADLKVTSTQEYSEGTSSGLIITQTPSSGDVNPGSSIKAVISKGKAIVVGTYKGTTNTSIQEGLKLSKVEVYSNSAAGTVLEQSPSAGTPVDNGSTVTLTVSIGKPSVSSFAGQPLKNLQDQINTLNSKGANLSLSKSGEEYNAISNGSIISNTSGTINVGSSVSYVASKGESVTVGNYVGSPIPGNVKLNFSITGRSYHPNIPANSIISQSIISGTVVAANSTINVVLSDGVEPVFDLPHLAGLVGASTSYQSSVDIISNYLRTSKPGCSINSTFTKVSDGVGAGLVVSQSPGPGPISCSTTVSVTISDN